MEEQIATALARIDDILARFDVGWVWSMFSGGDDSLATLLVARRHPKFDAALHLDTGIGVPETRQFVWETCERLGVPLLYYKAPDHGSDYDAIVRRHGFPGKNENGHRQMYNQLKDRPLDAAFREHGGGTRRKAVLLNGCRSSESSRRMGNVKPYDVEKRRARRVWLPIIRDWSKEDVLRFIEAEGVERNPVSKNLCKSGECLCGAFAKPGELAELRIHYPEVASRIERLQTEVNAAGFPWGWEESPPSWWKDAKRGQGLLFDPACTPHLCSSCVYWSEQ